MFAISTEELTTTTFITYTLLLSDYTDICVNREYDTDLTGRTSPKDQASDE